MKKKLLLMLISLTTVSAVGVTVYFEVVSNTSGVDPGGDPGTLVPIDGGLSVLMLTGAALGVQQMQRKWSKKKKDEDSRSSL